MKWVTILSILTTSVAQSAVIKSSELLKGVPRLPIGLYRHLRRTESLTASDRDRVAERYPTQYFTQQVSHDPTQPSDDTFEQRYWFDATYYRPGGPVILLDGGETDGKNRLTYIESGILRILSEATGGLSVVLEHRYYGESMPTSMNESTDSYRFLSTLQSLQDSANFARNVKFAGLRGDVTSKHAAWISYGGSYAGAKSAFLRKLYPDVFWGAIASSAVTTGILNFWEYYEPIRLSGPPACISNLIDHTTMIDALLNLDSTVTHLLKSYFGLGNLTSSLDFVNTLSIPLGTWQARNWDAAVGSRAFYVFCEALEDGSDVIANVDQIAFNFKSMTLPSFSKFSSYARYIRDNVVSLCPEGATQDECFGTDSEGGQDGEDSDVASWKSWIYQICTEWGYFMPSAPTDQPSLISRLLTLEYVSSICGRTFPPGKLISIPATPNLSAVNQYGSFDLSFDRLAFIDGSEDPWLYATPHSPLAKPRKDTLRRPFKLIDGGVHHWDENGNSNEPRVIKEVHAGEIAFVKEWMREWENWGR